jgi:hypothetical protein
MSKKEHPKEKSMIHPRNKNRERYDFKQLIECSPELTTFVKPNIYGDMSIDFANPAAVMALNKAILHHHYKIPNWDILPDICVRQFREELTTFITLLIFWKKTILKKFQQAGKSSAWISEPEPVVFTR